MDFLKKQRWHKDHPCNTKNSRSKIHKWKNKNSLALPSPQLRRPNQTNDKRTMNFLKKQRWPKGPPCKMKNSKDQIYNWKNWNFLAISSNRRPNQTSHKLPMDFLKKQTRPKGHTCKMKNSKSKIQKWKNRNSLALPWTLLRRPNQTSYKWATDFLRKQRRPKGHPCKIKNSKTKYKYERQKLPFQVNNISNRLRYLIQQKQWKCNGFNHKTKPAQRSAL